MDKDAKINLIHYRISAAYENLDLAKIAFGKKAYRACVRELYYAMFQMVLALLLSKNLIYKTHKSTINSFSQNFILTKEFSHNYSKLMNKLLTLRQKADYSGFLEISPELLSEYIFEVEQFLSEAKEYLDKWIEQQNETTKTK